MGYETRRDGYTRYRCWDRTAGREQYVYVHQLVAIANGADPTDIFDGGQTHVHHRNGIKYDNRSANLEVLDREAHAKQHAAASGD